MHLCLENKQMIQPGNSFFFQFAKATFKAFEETLWRSLHAPNRRPQTAIRWQHNDAEDVQAARRKQLEEVEKMLATADAKVRPKSKNVQLVCCT